MFTVSLKSCLLELCIISFFSKIVTTGLDLLCARGLEAFVVGVMFDSLCQCSVLDVFSVKPTIPYHSYFFFSVCSGVGVGDQWQARLTLFSPSL